MTRSLRFARCLAAGLVLLSAAARADDPDAAEKNFLEWATLAASQNNSPATADRGDFEKRWQAPDGRSVRIVVKVPRPRADAPTVTLPAVPPGEDARPYFETALAQARSQRAGKFVIPRGTYTFKTVGKGGLGHLMLQGLSDIVIEGNDSTLLFTQNQPGIYINTSQRLKLTHLAIDYTLHTSSLGTIESRDGNKVLVIDRRYPVTSADAVYYASEFDPKAMNWVHNGQRAIMPPGSTTPAVFAGDQTYTSAAFKNLGVGKTFAIFHHWYGGAAIRIDDTPGPLQDEDITIDRVSIHSAPGMGILTYGLKRSLAILNSSVDARADGSNPVSTEFDAFHVLYGGGDIVIANNHIANQGDDGINLNNPVHPIVSISEDGKTIVMSTYSRFISAGDSLAFFDSGGKYLGRANVIDKPKALGGLNNQVTIDRPIAGLDVHGVVRDVALITSRFYVANNVIEQCNCHGLLVQLPNGLVEGNTFSRLNYNAIRLLTNVGSWKEGVGAFNVAVVRNRISGTGVDTSLPMPWAAISAYGGARGNKVADEPVNKDIDISDNVVTDAQQGCVTVASSRSVRVANNECNSTNLREPGKPSINVVNGAAASVDKNRRSGTSTGGMDVDRRRAKGQDTY